MGTKISGGCRDIRSTYSHSEQIVYNTFLSVLPVPLATAMHGTWGSFWMAYGLLNLLFAIGVMTPPATNGLFVELGYWFIVLAAITWVGTWIATASNGALTAVLGFLAAGSTAMAIAGTTVLMRS